MRFARAIAACALLLLATGAGACEARFEPLADRIAVAGFENRTASGRHESWAPRSARLEMVAGFAELTDEYAHNVLGPLRDAKVLTIHIRRPGDPRISCPAEAALPDGHVFEDIAPRLADMDGDGLPEVVVVQSDRREGARLAIYDRRARLIAATPPIGSRNRWLAPVGAGDFDGDGHAEVAYVDRPHLAKVLRVWRFDGNRLLPVAAEGGFSNHAIGDSTISSGIRTCGQGPEMILPDAARNRLMSVRLGSDRLLVRDIGPFRGQADLARALTCP